MDPHDAEKIDHLAAEVRRLRAPQRHRLGEDNGPRRRRLGRAQADIGT